MQCTGAIVDVDSRTWKLHGLYHMIFSAIVHFKDAVFLIFHIEFDRQSLVGAREVASWPSCVLMKSGGKRKNKVHRTVDLRTKVLMGFFQYSTMSCW